MSNKLVFVALFFIWTNAIFPGSSTATSPWHFFIITWYCDFPRAQKAIKADAASQPCVPLHYCGLLVLCSNLMHIPYDLWCHWQVRSVIPVWSLLGYCWSLVEWTLVLFVPNERDLGGLLVPWRAPLLIGAFLLCDVLILLEPSNPSISICFALSLVEG